MRNFKKFLALVLAMLMVSACAVSVSGAFADQAAIDATDNAAAIATLTDLGVINGKVDGQGVVTYDPAGSLARDEAAAIAARMVAGSKSVEFAAVTTCPFADVVDKWSFGYISYVADRGVMEGTGNGFEPKKTLSVAEAVAICVKMLGLKSEVVALDKISTPSPWYINYIDVAEQYGLLNNIDVFSYAQTCSRAEMAQIAYNTIVATKAGFVNKIAAGFDFQTKTVKILSVADGKVYVDTALIGAVDFFDEAALNEALTTAGYAAKAADLKGVSATVTYNKGKIYSIAVNSDVKTFTYADGLLSVAKDSSGKNTDNVVFDGLTYIAGAGTTTADNGGAIGAGSTTKAGISITIKAAANGTAVAYEAKADLPEYYKATAYDDNKDGVYNRIVIEKYEFGKIKENSADAETYKDVKYSFDTITNLFTGETFTNKTADKDNYKNIVYTGDVVKDNTTPVLYKYSVSDDGKTWNVDVLEAAAVVTGKLTAVSVSGKYVTVDSVKYTYAHKDVAAVDSWTLNQTISIYTIGGKFVAVADKASKSTLKIAVDNVVVEDGKAVVTGFNVNDNFSDITITVDGVLTAAGKLVAKKSYANTAKVDNKEYIRPVIIADKDSAGNVTTTYATLLDGAIYTFIKTTDGVYFEADSGKTIATFANGAEKNGTLTVNASYIYEGTVPQYFNKNAVIIVPVSESGADTAAGKYNAYGTTYAKSTSFAKAEGVTYKVNVVDSNKVNFVYISNKGTGEGTTLTSVTTIVQIKGAAFEYGYDFSTYHAIDVMTGKAVDVKTAGTLTDKAYYTVTDGVVSDYETGALWMEAKKIDVIANGVVSTIKAMPVKLHKASIDGAKWEVQNAASEKATYGVNITFYNVDADGYIALDNDGNAKTVDVSKLTDGTYVSYIVSGKMIVVANSPIA